jgi:hypothetical protein
MIKKMAQFSKLSPSKSVIYVFLMLLFFGLSAEKCSKSTSKGGNDSTNKANMMANAGQELNDILNKTWMHSREESGDKYDAYRPEGFDFPPSRGREGFKIFKNGDFIQLSIAPQDGIQEDKGSWSFDKKSQTISVEVASRAGTSVKPYKMKVLEANSKILKVKRIFE